jgi:hypothetical protein
MANKLQQHILLASGILLAVALLFTAYTFAFFYSQKDVEDVKIEGVVLDHDSHLPLSGVSILIKNERYTDDKGNYNYDEYLGHDSISLKTDNFGRYVTIIPKSAFIWIEFKKNGYNKSYQSGKHSTKHMKFETNLKRRL